MPDATAAATLRAFAAERRYSAATAERCLALAPADAAALLDLARQLRPSENQLRDLWQWSEEIAERDNTSLAAVLAAPSITAARRRRGRSDAIKSVKDALRRLRFPQLAAAEDRLHVLLRDLGLPRSVSVTLPPFLEGDELRVEIVAASPATLRAAAAALLAAADTPVCEEIFRSLTEAP